MYYNMLTLLLLLLLLLLLVVVNNFDQFYIHWVVPQYVINGMYEYE
jgi:hypothetical protein